MKKIKLPKYQEIRSFLLEKLSDGTFSVGDRFYSDNQLKDLFKVSNLTVRKALSFLEDEGFVKRIHGAGSFVASMPSRPRNIKIIEHRALGILTGEIDLEDNMVLGKILINLHNAAASRGYMIYLGHNTAKELIESKVDGIISFGFMDEKTVRVLKDSSVPVVSFGAYHDKLFPCIKTDLFDVGYKVCKFLTESGHKKILALGSGRDAEQIKGEIWTGMNEYLKEAAIPENILSLRSALRQDDFGVLLDEFSSASKRPDAVFMLNSQSVPAVMRALGQLKLNAPEDVSLIGNGVNILSANTDPPLTAIYPDIKHGSEKAVEILLDMIKNEKTEIDDYIFKSRIHDRGSCKKRNN
jgi:GntR family transcriptional regulator of arabinose operon